MTDTASRARARLYLPIVRGRRGSRDGAAAASRGWRLLQGMIRHVELEYVAHG